MDRFLTHCRAAFSNFHWLLLLILFFDEKINQKSANYVEIQLVAQNPGLYEDDSAHRGKHMDHKAIDTFQASGQKEAKEELK